MSRWYNCNSVNIYWYWGNTSTVTCYTMKGEQLWEHIDVSVLTDPRDVTVENKFNVYVTSYTCNSVVVLDHVVDKDDNLLIAMMDWALIPDYILTNLRTVCWLLTTMDRLSCIMCVKSWFSVSVLLYILGAKRKSSNFLQACYFSKTLVLFQIEWRGVCIQS